MLLSLRISNYALINSLDINFCQGFSVITGETGAGKSIILGALGMVLGQRADTKAIRDGASKCIVEADFDIEGYGLQSFFEQNDLDYSSQCTIRKEINTNGKSRSFVNDTPINLSALKELGNRLIDIHSQHENLQLGNDDFQRQVVDNIANNETARKEYTIAYQAYSKANKLLEDLKQRAEQEKADIDYIEFQLSQLEQAKLQEGEETNIETQLEQLTHAEEIKSLLSECNNALSGEQSVVNLLRISEQYVGKIARYMPQLDDVKQRLKSVVIETKDIADELDTQSRNIEYDPERQLQLEQRLDLLNTLMTKHHVNTSKELIEIRDNLQSRLGQINSFDNDIAVAEQNYQKCRETLENAAGRLSNTRFAIKNNTEQTIKQLLQQLGIKHAEFEIRFEKTEHFESHGCDKIAFLFSANKNQQMQDVANVASGGEIARIMLAIKSLVGKHDNKMQESQPTLLFDEIDTGVSGEIADSMGKIMSHMSKNRQIISITHLPQIASRGETHYKVYKTDTPQSTETHIRQLNNDERVIEIASMLSGNKITDAAIANAKELLLR